MNMTKIYIDTLDDLVEKGLFLDRNQVIREGLRLLFMRYNIKPFSERRGMYHPICNKF